MSEPAKGLLWGLWEIQQIVQAEGCSWEVAQQRWLESRKEPETNVIRVDFRRGDVLAS